MEQDNRQSRLIGRHVLRQITTDERCQDCGARVAESVGVRLSAGVAGFAGIATCGRIWLCPVCNSKVMARRALEVGLALNYARSRGWLVLWGALTSWHNMHSPLGELLEQQKKAWRSMTNGREWRSHNATQQRPHACTIKCAIPNTDIVQLGPRAFPCGRQDDYELLPAGAVIPERRVGRHRDPVTGKHDAAVCEKPCRKRFDYEDLPPGGRVGYIRAAEINVGGNGWHPHFHPIIFYQGSKVSAQHLADVAVRGWVTAIEKAGGQAAANGAQQIKVLTPEQAFEQLGEYVTKQTYVLALEAVWSQNKTAAWTTLPNGRKSNSKTRQADTEPHWTLLAEIVADGSMDEIDRWHELEAAVPDHRMITWSRGLRDFAGVGPEELDEVLAAQELGSVDDTVCFIDGEGWDVLHEHPEVQALILSTLETGGWPGLRALLDQFKIPYHVAAWQTSGVPA